MEQHPSTSEQVVHLPPIVPQQPSINSQTKKNTNRARVVPLTTEIREVPQIERSDKQEHARERALSPTKTVTSNTSTTTSIAELKNEPRCLCGACRVTVGTMVLSVCELLLICHSLIFAFSNWSASPEKYESYSRLFAIVIKYDYLMPFIIINLLWMAASIILLVGVKIPFYPLLLPHIAVQALIVLGGTMLTVVAIINLQDVKSITWTLAAALALCIFVTLAQVYLIYIVVTCFRHLKRLQLANVLEKRRTNSKTGHRVSVLQYHIRQQFNVWE